ncbi:hypothetical protein OG753_01950 [Streptomyces sp. NBC_00029]|uniref:tetratricopeptide repeat protein n=1 Tax=Streptomyces sp. NBC_00029 TaxID=2903613 RepID=UPI00324A2347
MDAADLDRRARTLSGCIPPLLVSRLLELGHEQEVEFQARRGEWFCAREWARLLGDRGRQAQALEVLAPYVATGWWPAGQAQAELLESWGRAAEAIALARPYARVGGFKLEFLARLLARHGRRDEAVGLLSAGIEDPALATALVEVAEGTGRDEDVAALLAARIPARHRCDEPWCCRGLDPDTAIGLLAVIRERQGRLDEAIALLRTRQVSSSGGRDRLADLLARHGRTGELRAYAAIEAHGNAARRLAELLEERGDLEGALAVYRQPDGPPAGGHPDTVELALLLARHGRGDEAIEVLRTLADAPGGAEDRIVHALCTQYAEHGRAREGVAHLDALRARRGGEEEEDVFRARLRLMADCGLLDEAIEQAGVYSGEDPGYAAGLIADLLAATGRTAEAVAILEQHAPYHHTALAGHLIELGRVEDAVALLQQREAEPFVPIWSGTFDAQPRP